MAKPDVIFRLGQGEEAGMAGRETPMQSCPGEHMPGHSGQGKGDLVGQ